MVLDSKIQLVKEQCNIQVMDDWRRVSPFEVLQLDGVGQVTLDHIRLYLAGHDITLKNDATPAYWMAHLSESRICHTMGESDRKDVNPFTVLIDSMEQLPFTFQGMKGDASQRNREIIVPTEWKSLGVRVGKFYEPRGDYSIQGCEGEIHIERKSGPDAHSTILGWQDRRDRFARELQVLSEIKYAAVVVECSLGALIVNAPSRGKKSAQENAKIIHRQVLAWMQDYRVPWIFADTRRLAEITTFQILRRFWRKLQEESKKEMTLEGVAT